MDKELEIFKKLFDSNNVEFDKITDKVLEMPQAECPLTHTLGDGFYTRQRMAKAGTLLMGKRHRYETTSVLLVGELSIYIDGSGFVEHKIGPCIWKTPAGTRRMTYSVTDNVLVTTHENKYNETDIEKIENELTISEEDFLKLETVENAGGLL